MHRTGLRIVAGLAIGFGMTRAIGAAASGDEKQLAGSARERVDAAIERGARWLLARQDARGAFPPRVEMAASEVALSAVALWAIAPLPHGSPDHAAAAVDYLVKHKQADGGIYDPKSGLAVYTSGIAAQALRALPEPRPPQLLETAQALELFVYRRAIPESYIDLAEKTSAVRTAAGDDAARILARPAPLADEQRRALEFLAQGGKEGGRAPQRTRNPLWKAPGAAVDAFSYDDLLPFVYLPLAPDHQIAQRAYASVRENWDLERNPDLTRRYGAAGFELGTQGLYYYYLVLARTLSVQASPWLTTAAGERHDWTLELARKLVALQQPDGSWVSRDARWWENEPVLVTSYALVALQLCRDVAAAPAR